MKFSSLLISMIFLSVLSNDVLFELLIGIMALPIEGGPLFEKLEDVDHYFRQRNLLLLYMIKKVLKNAGSLSTMRILSRVVQFLLKTYLIRTQLDEEILAHLLHLDLILNTSLHIVRSCFKPSYQKVQNQDNVIKSAMNIMTYGILATFLSALFVSGMQYYQFVASGKMLLNFTNSIAIYAIAAVFEAIAEKYMVEFVIKYEYLKIGMAEVICVIPKTLSVFLSVYLNLVPKYGILNFAVSQLLYSATLMLIFYFMAENKTIFLQPITTGETTIYVDQTSKRSLKQFSVMSLLKYVLQEFQQIVLVVMDVSHISSMYSLINNLGSTVVRYLFAPFNEIVYNHFSRGSQEQSIKGLLQFVKYILTLSIALLSFGYNFTQTSLLLLYGDKWVNRDSIKAMRTYMVLVVFLGLNGVIEAFLFARGKQSINKYNYFSFITTGIYLGSTILFLNLGMGAAGLFMGNIINMASRICVCWFIQIRSHITFSRLLAQIRPSWLFLVTSLITFILGHKKYGVILSFSSNILYNCLGAAVLLAINLCPLVFQNRRLLLQQLSKLIKRKRE